MNDSELARRFRDSAIQSAPRAPLNAALADAIARRPNLWSLLGEAPTEQQLPVLLLAAIHHLVLADPDHRLARWYPNITESPFPADDPRLAATLETFVMERADEVRSLVRTRRVQTNEVGRCAVLLPAFGMIGDEVGPVTHLDVGTSAGLNLLLPRFAYRYDDRPLIGDHTSSVELECSTRGTAPTPLTDLEMPNVRRGCGVDLRPIDISDADDARWLEACCWPDQADRFHRLRAAIELARATPPDVVQGDAVDSLSQSIERLSTDGHPVVTTTWALNYLPPDRRTAFVDELDRLAEHTDLSWISAEAPALTPELPHAVDPVDPHRTELTLVTWRAGRREVRHLAETHPHGYWIHWR
ncbi:hypothetical protein YM304_20890 [Ilumatobacter coccineus YM16-304]|uniref:DUF2332 domain-containing protein n=2 Tax=Ilumatobacter coccineus TaxID=467094 RepID=A0A6C7E7Q8_ILUCY|nr:hypothetical protein YM304_20890 [Ilumatobacter coccineus YM16-304]